MGIYFKKNYLVYLLTKYTFFSWFFAFFLEWFSYVFTYNGDNENLKGFLSAVQTVVGTSYCIGSLLCIFLNLVVPNEWFPETLAEEEEKRRKEIDEIRNGFLQSDIVEEHSMTNISGLPTTENRQR